MCLLGFLDPADIEPASVRTAELTPMMLQLVASGRGVACLPNWAVTEYLPTGISQSDPLVRMDCGVPSMPRFAPTSLMTRLLRIS